MDVVARRLCLTCVSSKAHTVKQSSTSSRQCLMTSSESSTRHQHRRYQHRHESRLLEACQWLVASGFPQYVQMLIETQLDESCLNTLISEHVCFTDDWIQAVQRRLNVLVRFSNSKTRLSEDFLRCMDAFVADEISRHAISQHWRYDTLSCRWQRLADVTSSSSPTGGAICLSAAAGSLSPSSLATDGGNHATTSGYESETTMMTSSNDVSPLTSSSSTSSSRRSVVPDGGLTLPLCDDSGVVGGTPTPTTPVDCLGVVVRRRSSPMATTATPRSVSFYDNLLQSDNSLLLSDPQTELETILDDLRRNISALDAALQAAGTITSPVTGITPTTVSVDNGCQQQQPAVSGGHVWLLTVSRWTSDVRLDRRSLVSELSADELAVARQLSVVHMTSLIDKYCGRQMSPAAVRNLIRCVSSSLTTATSNGQHYDSAKRVFGAPLDGQFRTTGLALPQCIAHAMNDVIARAADNEGVFRKPGVLSRVQKLQEEMEAHPDIRIECDVTGDVYNLADVIKRYYRDLPESLLTDCLTPVLVAIFDYIPEDLRLEAVRSAILLLPDVNRVAVYRLLTFLHDVASYCQHNQMTAANLAVCFLPSLFRLSDYGRHQKMAPPVAVSDEEYQPGYKTALTCMTSLIQHSTSLTQISGELVYAVGQLTKSRDWLQLVPCTSDSGAAIFSRADVVSVSVHVHSLFDKLNFLLQSESVGWVPDRASSTDDVTVVRQMSPSSLDVASGLFTWRATVAVEAPPSEVLTRLTAGAESDWDPDVTQWRTCLRLDASTDVVEFTTNAAQLSQPRGVCLLRSWRSNQSTGRCLLVSTSVVSPTHQQSVDIVASVVMSHYVIEPCGTGMSRLNYFSSVDFRGQTFDWYRVVYGRLCARHVTRLRDSFRHDSSTEWSEGPETKV